MNGNENLVKKKDKEKDEEEFEEEEEIELEDDTSSNKKTTYQDSAKKRMMKVMAFIVGGTILLIFILYIVSLVSGRKYTYDQIEEILTEAAEGYFADYPDSLPKEDGSIVEVDSSNLVAAGKMKDLNEYTKDNVTCTGSVQVEKSGSEYLYTPFLDCGSDYSTVELYKEIVNDDSIVNSGDGLYSRGGSYYFRGENVNNYVQLDKSLWRIVKVTSDDNVVLIHSDGLDYYQPWDNRYNESRYYESGINTYSISRMKEYLDRIYSNPVEDDGELILSKKDKARLISYNVCVGKRDANSEVKDNSLECKEVLKNQKLGLLTLSDYLYVSLDPNCKNASTKSCMNYNYLSIDDEWWLVTANSADTSTAYKVDRDGIVKTDITATYSKVRPVIYLNSKALIKGGKGTLKDPYVLK